MDPLMLGLFYGLFGITQQGFTFWGILALLLTTFSTKVFLAAMLAQFKFKPL